MSKFITLFLTLTTVLVLVGTLSGCPGKLAPSTAKTNFISNSEVAEAVISGAVTGTSPGLLNEARYIPHKYSSPKEEALAQIRNIFSMIPRADAAVSQGACANLNLGSAGPYAANSGCGYGPNSAGQPFTTLTWAPCNGGAPLGTWSGGVNLTLLATPGFTTMACAGAQTFQNGDVLWRTFFSPSARINNFNLDPKDGVTPWNPLTQQDLIEPNGPVTALVDTYGATTLPVGFNITTTPLPSNFPLAGYSGYSQQIATIGEIITFSGPTARTIEVKGLHVKGAVAGYITWDFTISSTYGAQPFALINVTGANLVTAGNLYIQDNLNKIVTKSAVTGNMTYTGACGVPFGGVGQITTTLVTSNGKAFPTETLDTFSGALCGQANLNAIPTYLFHSF